MALFDKDEMFKEIDAMHAESESWLEKHEWPILAAFGALAILLIVYILVK